MILTTVSRCGTPRIRAPMPLTPAAIRATSATAQIATTTPTCSRRSPCRSRNAFCAPTATISERLNANPESAASI